MSIGQNRCEHHKLRVMREVATRFLVLVLISAMTPGALELSENLFHLAWQGHAAHESADGDDHGPVDDEHGCTPSQHFCGCHSSLAFAQVPTPAADGPSHLAFLFNFRLEPTSAAPPRGVDRPPRA